MNKLPNPYAPPRANPPAPRDAAPLELADASTNRRFANLVVDMVGRIAFSTVFTMIGLLLDIKVPSTLLRILLGLLSMFSYYVLLEGLFGLTLGKLVTGTRVVALDGKRPSLGAVALRTLSRFVPFDPFSFLMGAPRGWHDRWSGTRVVQVQRGVRASGRLSSP